MQTNTQKTPNEKPSGILLDSKFPVSVAFAFSPHAHLDQAQLVSNNPFSTTEPKSGSCKILLKFPLPPAPLLNETLLQGGSEPPGPSYSRGLGPSARPYGAFEQAAAPGAPGYPEAKAGSRAPGRFAQKETRSRSQGQVRKAAGPPRA